MRLIWVIIPLVLIGIIGIQESFAEKIVSIQKTVDVDKKSLIDSLSNLEKYSQILPDYIQSSRLIEDNTGRMKIGLDWITVDADIKFIESSDKVTLEVISGDFKGTKLYVTMDEKNNLENILDGETTVYAEIQLQRSWYMEILTSFVSDSNIKSMLHTSLDGLVEYAKNPQTSDKIIEKKEKFCIFSLCF